MLKNSGTWGWYDQQPPVHPPRPSTMLKELSGKQAAQPLPSMQGGEWELSWSGLLPNKRGCEAVEKRVEGRLPNS